MKLHRFNERGLCKFNEFLDGLISTPLLAMPGELLSDPAFADEIAGDLAVENRQFANRMEAAKYLYDLISRLPSRTLERDVGLWSWLTAYFFDQICPMNSDGLRIPKARPIYFPEMENSRRFYRHALFGPYLAFQAHRENPIRASVLLSDPMHVAASEGYRLFIETPLINMEAPVEIATRFYFDASTGKLRRGSGTKGAGGLRRFIAVLQQLDVTFDLHQLEPSALAELLPKEFDKWQSLV